MKSVCIIGAGPTGLSLAYFLHALKIPFRIFDKRKEPSSTSKALGIQARTQEILQISGLLKKFKEQGFSTKALNIYNEGEKVLSLDLNYINSEFNQVLIHPQSLTEKVFIEALQSEGVKIEREFELLSVQEGDEGLTVSLRQPDGTTQVETFDYLCGCDGSKSSVREAFKIPFEGVEDPERFYLADATFSGEQPDRSSATLELAEQTVTVIFPMPGNLYRIIANRPERDVKVGDQYPSKEDIQTILDRRSLGHFRIESTTWRSYFYIHYRLAQDFQVGNTFILGDAAHIHSPAGGQGMNTGIQDAYNLAWKLNLVIRGQATPELLKTYSLERREFARSILNFSSLLTRMATEKNPIFTGLRNLAWKWVLPNETIQRKIADKIGQVAFKYPVSLDVAGSHFSIEALLSGDSDCLGRRFDNIALGEDLHGKPHKLFDLYHPGKFTLLFYLSDTTRIADVRACVENVSGRFPECCELVLVVPHKDLVWEPELWNGHIYIDNRAVFETRYNAGQSRMVLIRPDGYLAFKGSVTETGDLLKFLEGFMIPKVVTSSHGGA